MRQLEQATGSFRLGDRRTAQRVVDGFRVAASLGGRGLSEHDLLILLMRGHGPTRAGDFLEGLVQPSVGNPREAHGIDLDRGDLEAYGAGLGHRGDHRQIAGRRERRIQPDVYDGLLLDIGDLRLETLARINGSRGACRRACR